MEMHLNYIIKYEIVVNVVKITKELLMVFSNLRHQIPKEIPVSFHNVSTYHYHFIIKKLAKEFESQIECVGENVEKYMSFSVQVIQKLMVRMVKELHTK